MTAQVDVADRTADFQNAVAEPNPTLAARLREIQAIFFVGLGLLVTIVWIAVLGWLLYRAVLMLGFV